MRTGQVTVCAEGPDGHADIHTYPLDGRARIAHRAPKCHHQTRHILGLRRRLFARDLLRGTATLRWRELSGWVQSRPVDPPLCVGYRADDAELWLTLAYGEIPLLARANARAVLDPAIAAGADAHRAATAAWWDAYWRDVPHLDLPNPTLDFLYTYGMFKFAGLTHPEGIAAGLQGPWIEETNMPPWSGDYHFNINVQMCYWPAYRGNRLAHLKPLFEMIASWQPQLRKNARIFVDDPTFDGRRDAAPRRGRPLHLYGRLLDRFGGSRLHGLGCGDDVPLLRLFRRCGLPARDGLPVYGGRDARVRSDAGARRGRLGAARQRVAGVSRGADERLGPQRQLPTGLHPLAVRTSAEGGRGFGRNARSHLG